MRGREEWERKKRCPRRGSGRNYLIVSALLGLDVSPVFPRSNGDSGDVSQDAMGLFRALLRDPAGSPGPAFVAGNSALVRRHALSPRRPSHHMQRRPLPVFGQSSLMPMHPKTATCASNDTFVRGQPPSWYSEGSARGKKNSLGCLQGTKKMPSSVTAWVNSSK